MICAGAVALVSTPCYAQVDAGAAIRNIDNNKDLSLPERKEAPAQSKLADKSVYVNRLAEVVVDAPLIQSDMQSYWESFKTKTITNQDIADFKEWAWNKFRAVGYFAYINTSISATAEGEVLMIKTTLPKIKNIKIVAKNASLEKRYSEQIQRRLAKYVVPGSEVDTLSLEQNLDNISFDMPLELALKIRPLGLDQVELIVDVTEKSHSIGKIINGGIQFNDYGLHQYGRYQGLGTLTLEGLTPGSSLNLLTQGAEGLAYGRVDYDMPWSLIGGHLRVWANTAYSADIIDSKSASEVFTVQYGLGTTHILGSFRDKVLKSYVDISQRSTESKLQSSGMKINSIFDNQLKLNFTLGNESLATDNVEHYELMVVTGIDDNHGEYVYAGASGSFQKNLNDQGLYFVTHAKAQGLTNRNLNSYNRIALGGVNGVRAYTTVDGLGDIGGMWSVELRQKYAMNHYGGIFYDGGVVKENNNAISGQYNSAYFLQGVGISLGGMLKPFNYSASFAKGIGGYDGYNTSNNESTPDNWHIFFSLSYML
jgi:hemolysin activation/secretion protein